MLHMSNPNKGVHLSMYAGFEAQGLTAGVGVGCVNTRDLRAIRFVESIAAIVETKPNFNLSNTSSYGRESQISLQRFNKGLRRNQQ